MTATSRFRGRIVLGRNGEIAATLVGIVAILLWAALALTTVQARGIPPFELLALSFGVAFVAGMAMLCARGPAALMQLRQPWAPWLTAFLGIFLYHALYFFALGTAPAAQASLIAYLWPLFIVLLSAMLPGGTSAGPSFRRSPDGPFRDGADPCRP